MAPSPVLDQFVALLCERHGLSELAAMNITYRAARAKSVTMHDIAAFVVEHTPLPAPVVDVGEADALRVEVARQRDVAASRDVVGQATGILMERHGEAANQASDRLRAMAADADADVATVAAITVDLRTDVPVEDSSRPT